MNNSPPAYLDLWRVATSFARRWIFWRAFIRIWLALMILFAAIEIPGFLRSVEVDKKRVVDIIEGRRRFAGEAIARVFDLGSRILGTTNAIESTVLLDQIRTRNPSYPGVVGLATLHRSTNGTGWSVHQESARNPWTLMSRLLGQSEVTELLAMLQNSSKPGVSRLFRLRGADGTTSERVHAVCVYPRTGDTDSSPSPRPQALALVVDVRAWVEEQQIPQALTLLDFHISNEPPDSIFINLNSDAPSDGAGVSYIPIELGPGPDDPISDLASWRFQQKRTEASATTPYRPSKATRSRAVLFDGFMGHPVRIHVDIPQGFLQSRARLLILQNMPFRFFMTTLVSLLLAFMWILVSSGKQQIRRLGEAQQTIERLSLHRSLIQQELHDHIIQNLTLLGIQVAAASPKDLEGFQGIRSAVLRQLDYLRGELRRLLMDGTHRLGSFDEMIAQVRSICRHLEEQSGARCSLTCSNPDQFAPSPEILFRTCRFVEELIANAIRHGGARRIGTVIETDAEKSLLIIRVSDDGKGFDPAKHSPGFGLQSMSAFARRSKGSLTIERILPRGMQVSLTLPLTPAAVRL